MYSTNSYHSSINYDIRCTCLQTSYIVSTLEFKDNINQLHYAKHCFSDAYKISLSKVIIQLAEYVGILRDSLLDVSHGNK